MIETRIILSDFVNSVKDTINKYHMFSKKDKVIVGVSGGADSIALLFALKAMSLEMDIELFAVHLNHLIRGECADYDAIFSEKICKALDIPCKIVVKDIKSLAKETKCSLEEAGRKARYEEFIKYKEEINGDKIALAHHMNDQAETILLNLLRGTGLKGLGGMLPIRKDIIRPLIEVSKNDILEFCHSHDIKYVQDASNFDNYYSRNRIRNELIPYIENNFNSNIVNQLNKMGILLREDECNLRKVVEKKYERIVEINEYNSQRLDLEMLKSCESGIRKRIYRKAIELIASELKNIEAKHIELIEKLIMKDANKTIDLPGGIKAKVSYNRLNFYKDTPEKMTFNYYVDSFLDDIYLEEIQVKVIFKCMAYDKSKSFPRNDYTKWFDYDKMKNGFSIRSREIGDFINLKGMSGKKKIKQLLIDEKVEVYKRDRIPLIACGSKVIWAIGYRANRDYMITENTKQILEISIIKEEKNEM